MAAARTFGPSRSGSGYAVGGPGGPYLGWSHANNRLELMDLAAYVDSLRQGYEAIQQGYGSLFGGGGGGGSAAGRPVNPWAASASGPGAGGRPSHGHRASRRHCGCGHGPAERHHDHDHGWGSGHDRRDEHDCGCAGDWDCTCCIEDADIVVYAHCGEVRVVPIEIENDTRSLREDVAVDVTEIRTSGGRVLPWRTATSTDGPLTLEPCSTTTFEVLVQINCGEEGKPEDKPPAGGDTPSDQKPGDTRAMDIPSRRADPSGDVDECTVGYFTIRLAGCATRPIVVAVSTFPFRCDSFRTNCSCSCC